VLLFLLVLSSWFVLLARWCLRFVVAVVVVVRAIVSFSSTYLTRTFE